MRSLAIFIALMLLPIAVQEQDPKSILILSRAVPYDSRRIWACPLSILMEKERQ